MSKIFEFQRLMQNNKYDVYIVPTCDFHGSEYVNDYFKAREFLSGFTGSAATLVITKDDARLWTDGRYFIQAQKELLNSDISLMKMGNPNFPTIEEYLINVLKDGMSLGFDGRLLNSKFVINLVKKIKVNITLKTDMDLVNILWNSRKELPCQSIYRLDEFFCGKSYIDKINTIRIQMAKHSADCHIITSLEDQAWLYNLRGNDVKNTPIFLSYTIITTTENILFIDLKKINQSIKIYLKDNNIIIKEYFDFYNYIKTLSNKKILLDMRKINYSTYEGLKDNNEFIDCEDPTIMLKAIKNDIEIKNTKLAHEKDGVAFVRFMKYVKENIGINPLTEISVSNFIEKERTKQDGFISLSFNTICGYKEHGAMMHYSASEATNSTLKPEGFLLIDSGAQYLDGTTDITRTISLGKLSETEKKHFTAVLKSMINLSTAKFLKGCNGQNLDILARGPIWDLDIDYKCGTGHGVGHVLSVHEAPNGFRWQTVVERDDSAQLLPGMITTNEPGIYLENEYGIRIENELLCKESISNQFGDFLEFETITYAPIDLDAININELDKKHIDWLNNYHENVYKILEKHLNAEEKAWLLKYTRKID